MRMVLRETVEARQSEPRRSCDRVVRRWSVQHVLISVAAQKYPKDTFRLVAHKRICGQLCCRCRCLVAAQISGPTCLTEKTKHQREHRAASQSKSQSRSQSPGIVYIYIPRNLDGGWWRWWWWEDRDGPAHGVEFDEKRQIVVTVVSSGSSSRLSPSAAAALFWARQVSVFILIPASGMASSSIYLHVNCQLHSRKFSNLAL